MALVVVFALAVVACEDGEPASLHDVDESAAYTAIVQWQASEQEPVVNDAGEEKLPVIYVVAADGDTIDVGVQAHVAAAADDVAHVRFADQSAEAFDDAAADGPVIDGGVMLMVGLMPPPAPTIDVEVVRFLSLDTSEPLTLHISADEAASDASGTAVATVTSVTPP